MRTYSYMGLWVYREKDRKKWLNICGRMWKTGESQVKSTQKFFVLFCKFFRGGPLWGPLVTFWLPEAQAGQPMFQWLPKETERSATTWPRLGRQHWLWTCQLLVLYCLGLQSAFTQGTYRHGECTLAHKWFRSLSQADWNTRTPVILAPSIPSFEELSIWYMLALETGTLSLSSLESTWPHLSKLSSLLDVWMLIGTECSWSQVILWQCPQEVREKVNHLYVGFNTEIVYNMRARSETYFCLSRDNTMPDLWLILSSSCFFLCLILGEFICLLFVSSMLFPFMPRVISRDRKPNEKNWHALRMILRDWWGQAQEFCAIYFHCPDTFYSEFPPACCFIEICKTRNCPKGGLLLGLL